jgi:peptidoglycan hydrolase CwlO-like protein
MDQQETTDEDVQLLAEQEEYETRLSPNNDTVVQLLSSLNANMCSMSESLKRLHEANDPHRDGVATAEISAKKAKLAHDSHNKSEDSESDSELLLDDERRTNVVETSTSQDVAPNMTSQATTLCSRRLHSPLTKQSPQS